MSADTPTPERVTLSDEERRAEVEALLPFAWGHSARCLSGAHSCWEDEDDPLESYESPWCTGRRKAAQKAYRREVNALLALRDRDLAAREQALREEMRADLLTDEAVAGLTRVANDADRDYSAMEWSADAGRKQDEPGDWFVFITRRVADPAAARIARGAR